jgi:chemotaxis protein histidine kinase CheA
MAKSSYIRPRRHISQKVPKSGGPTPQQAILKALNAAEELMDSYQGWAVDDLAVLWQKFQIVDEKKATKNDIAEMYNVAHEIRGQGGTFGYKLISTIADSLCKFLDGRRTLNHGELDVIKIHILAMKAVFNQELKGKQPELAEQLSELMQALRNKIDLRTNYGR